MKRQRRAASGFISPTRCACLSRCLSFSVCLFFSLPITHTYTHTLSRLIRLSGSLCTPVAPDLSISFSLLKRIAVVLFASSPVCNQPPCSPLYLMPPFHIMSSTLFSTDAAPSSSGKCWRRCRSASYATATAATTLQYAAGQRRRRRHCYSPRPQTQGVWSSSSCVFSPRVYSV